MKNNNFETALSTFLKGAQKIITDTFTRDFSKSTPAKLTSKAGHKFVKIISDGGSAWAFVNKENGDVLKPASWSAPAKHARGNIFDDANGLGSVSWTGPVYL